MFHSVKSASWCCLPLFVFLLAVTAGNSSVFAEDEPTASDAVSSEDSHAKEKSGEDHAADEKHDGGHGAGHGGTHDLGHGNAGKNLENPAEFKADLAIYTFVVFMLLLAILSKFAWPAIVKALEERENVISSNIAAAEQKHAEAKQLLAKHEAELAGTANQVRELLEEARRDAEHTKSQIVAEAKGAAAAESERAMRELRTATDVAMRTLAETSANLAVDLAGKVVQEKITPDHQARVVKEALAKISSMEPSQN